MTAATLPADRPTQWDLDLTRVFDAPRELVWQVWSDPAHLAQWWGPNGFTNPVCEVELRPGGALHIVMRGPDGVDYPMDGVFHEIVPPEKLVFTSTVDDGPDVHFEVLTTVTFTEQGGKTQLTLQARVVTATEAAAMYLNGMKEGWTQTLDKLVAYVRTLAAR